MQFIKISKTSSQQGSAAPTEALVIDIITENKNYF
jgi:hypothetical protein